MVRRACRDKTQSVQRLCLLDAMPVALALDKGRSSDPGLLEVCRRVAAHSLASGSVFRFRWIPSEWDAADSSSRGKKDLVKLQHPLPQQRLPGRLDRLPLQIGMDLLELGRNPKQEPEGTLRAVRCNPQFLIRPVQNPTNMKTIYRVT